MEVAAKEMTDREEGGGAPGQPVEGLAAALLWGLAAVAAPCGAAAMLCIAGPGELSLTMLGFALLYEAQILLFSLEAGRSGAMARLALLTAAFEFVLLALLAFTWLGLVP